MREDGQSAKGLSCAKRFVQQPFCCGSSRYFSAATLNSMPEERIKLALTGNRMAFRGEKGSSGPNISNPYHPPESQREKRDTSSGKARFESKQRKERELEIGRCQGANTCMNNRY